MTTKEMKFRPLISSNLESCHYDEGSKTLTVKFRNGSSYNYGGVVKDHYEGLINAKSAGKYLNGTIRERYKHKKM